MIQQHAVEITSQSSTYRVNIIITTTKLYERTRKTGIDDFSTWLFFVCLSSTWIFLFIRENWKHKKRKEETRPNQNMNYRIKCNNTKHCMKGIYITLQYYTTQSSPSHSPGLTENGNKKKEACSLFFCWCCCCIHTREYNSFSYAQSLQDVFGKMH